MSAMSEDLPTIAEASRRIAARDLSPVELTRSLIHRIEALDPQLNAYLLPTPDLAAASDHRPTWADLALAPAVDEARVT